MHAGTSLKTVLAIGCAAALCFALAGCSGSSASSAAQSSSAAAASSSASLPSAVAESANASSATTPSEAASSDTASASKAASGDIEYAPETSDAQDNVTLYALCELTGPELLNLLEARGYSWDDSQSAWIRASNGATYFALTEAGQFSRDDYNAATDKGATTARVSCNVVIGYDDAESALRGNAQCTIKDGYFNGNGGVAIVSSPSAVEYLAVVQPYYNIVYEIDLYSEEAIASGMLDQIYEEELGGTFQEVWKSITGEESYGA